MSIEEFPGAVAPAFCEEIVERFERSPALAQSMVKAKTGEHTLSTLRTGTQLWMQEGGDEWRAINDALAPALVSTMTAYVTKYPGLNALIRVNELECTMPVIERVMPGQGFDWHSDQTPSLRRVVAGLLYLRNVASGGVPSSPTRAQRSFRKPARSFCSRLSGRTITAAPRRNPERNTC